MRYSTDPMGFVAILILFGSILCHGVSPGGLPPGTLTFLWSRLLVYPRGLGECMHICAGSQTRTCTLSAQVLPGFGLMVLPTCTSLHLMVLYKYPYIHEEREHHRAVATRKGAGRGLCSYFTGSLCTWHDMVLRQQAGLTAVPTSGAITPGLTFGRFLRFLREQEYPRISQSAVA